MSDLLELRHLHVRYGGGAEALTAVRDVSFALAPGRALGVVGESGSGKSSIAGAILDLLGPAAAIAGEILFEGDDLRALSARQRRRLLGWRIGSVFQDPFTALNPAIPVGRQIAEPLVQHLGLAPRDAFDRACALLADMHVRRPREMAESYPHQLSGGMQQRALLAAAMACEPKLLILDEPTTALDVTVQAQILALLAELRRRKGVSLLFISHDLGVVRDICDELVVLYASEVVEQGDAAAVLRHPRHPYTKGLLASLPPLRAGTRATRLPSIAGGMADLRHPPTGCRFAPRCPFADADCSAAVPALADIGDRRLRCWKADSVGDWPVAAPAASPARPAGQGALLDIADVHKVFRGRLTLGGKLPHLRWRRREVVAVDGVSLTLAAGEVLGLVGESGCGKSTLGRLALRLLNASTGRVAFDGADVGALRGRALRRFRGRAQIIFQNAESSLNPRVSVGAALERPLALFTDAPAAERRRRVLELLDMVRLPHGYRSRYPHQLSGGEKQRVAIARALATRPGFIVCDEPVSALDVSVQAAIVNLMADLRDAFGLAYLFISHDLAVVAQISDRIAVMYRGRVCEIGSAASVLAPPFHPYTAALLAATPLNESNEDSAAGCPFHARCPHRVDPICATQSPPLRALSDTHSIACHLPLIREAA